MRQRIVLWAAAAALVACGLSVAAPGSKATAACGPAHARTLAVDGAVRVYARGNAVYGCSMRGTRVFRLGQRVTCLGAARIDPVVVAGELAAYGSERCGVDTGSTLVIVRRLTDGKQLRAAPATSPPGVESFQFVRSLVLRGDGAVAWIGTGSSIVSHGSQKIEVHKAGRHGPVVLLDSGAGVRPSSLTLHGSRLTWRDGAGLRHATLELSCGSAELRLGWPPRD